MDHLYLESAYIDKLLFIPRHRILILYSNFNYILGLYFAEARGQMSRVWRIMMPKAKNLAAAKNTKYVIYETHQILILKGWVDQKSICYMSILLPGRDLVLWGFLLRKIRGCQCDSARQLGCICSVGKRDKGHCWNIYLAKPAPAEPQDHRRLKRPVRSDLKGKKLGLTFR